MKYVLFVFRYFLTVRDVAVNLIRGGSVVRPPNPSMPVEHLRTSRCTLTQSGVLETVSYSSCFILKIVGAMLETA